MTWSRFSRYSRVREAPHAFISHKSSEIIQTINEYKLQKLNMVILNLNQGFEINFQHARLKCIFNVNICPLFQDNIEYNK